MFLPLKDALPFRRMPWVTLLLILVNVLVYVAGLMPANVEPVGSSRQVTRHDVWVAEYGVIPCELLGRCTNQPGLAVIDGGVLDPSPRTALVNVDAHSPVLTVFTSMFLHGGIIHLTFNLLFLWVYGNNVEDAMHPLGFLAFYLFGGVVATCAQAIATASATVPLIGASGAIAAVIAAYVVLYPRARILTLVVPPIVLWLPAWLVAGGWALLQFVATWQSIFAPTSLSGSIANVAHVAGFLGGIALVRVLAERTNPLYAERYPSTRR